MNLLARHPQEADPMLLPPREPPYILHDVLEKRLYGMRDQLVLSLGDCFLRFGVDGEFDTITAQFRQHAFRGKSFQSIGSAKPWNKYVGKECGWTWLAWNQQGYLDSALISFDGVEPNVLLYTICSAIMVFTIAPADKSLVVKADSNGKRNTRARR